MARILTIFGRNRSSRSNLSFQKFSNERKIIESIESNNSIGRSMAALIVVTMVLVSSSTRAISDSRKRISVLSCAIEVVKLSIVPLKRMPIHFITNTAWNQAPEYTLCRWYVPLFEFFAKKAVYASIN